MNTNLFNRFCLLAIKVLLTTLFAVPLMPGQQTSGAQRRRPNILFLLTDDQRFDDLGCMGNPVIRTPNLDGLAAAGVLFENAFATTAICCSSRASILTGQQMRRHGIRDFHTPLSADAMDQTYPVLLRKAGYRTGFLGKFAMGWPNPDIKHLSLPADKFDYWFGFPQMINYLQKVNGKKRHLTSLLADKAIDFLETNPAGQPFCLSISWKAPHGPWNYFDPDLPNPYENADIPLPATYTKAAFESEPMFLRKSLNGSPNGQWYPDAHERFQRVAHTHYRLITGMDVAVGRIMAALERLGLNDNTVILFTSDHGTLRGEHGLFGKWIMYESSIRVPLIVRDPRLPTDVRGTRRKEMVLNIDLGPTMLAMAAVPIPSQMQGCDFQPLLRGDKVAWRDAWYYEHTYNTKPPRAPIAKSEGVRTERWKYVRYPDQSPLVEQLFDLANDPREEHNLAGVEAYADRLATLRIRWRQLRQEAR